MSETNQQIPFEVNDQWLQVNRSKLKKVLPGSIINKTFFPNTNFYTDYLNNPDKKSALQEMAHELFKWLNIDQKSCLVSFYKTDGENNHPGAYLKGREKEIIVVDVKYFNNPVAIGAILAHEIMHLYLIRKKIGYTDRQENELLTDLATIYAGFSLLIINSAEHSSMWGLTMLAFLFGMIYWHSEEHAFGYFKPHEYGIEAEIHLKEIGEDDAKVLSYVNSGSKKYLDLRPTSKVKPANEYLEQKSKGYRNANIFQGVIATFVIGFVMYSSSIGQNTENNYHSSYSSNGSYIQLDDQDKIDDVEIVQVIGFIENKAYKNLQNYDTKTEIGKIIKKAFINLDNTTNLEFNDNLKIPDIRDKAALINYIENIRKLSLANEENLSKKIKILQTLNSDASEWYNSKETNYRYEIYETLKTLTDENISYLEKRIELENKTNNSLIEFFDFLVKNNNKISPEYAIKGFFEDEYLQQKINELANTVDANLKNLNNYLSESK